MAHSLDDLSEADRKMLHKGITIHRASLDERQIKMLELAAAYLRALKPQVKDLKNRAVINRLSRELDDMQSAPATSRAVAELLHPSDPVAARSAELKRVPWRTG